MTDETSRAISTAKLLLPPGDWRALETDAESDPVLYLIRTLDAEQAADRVEILTSAVRWLARERREHHQRESDRYARRPPINWARRCQHAAEQIRALARDPTKGLTIDELHAIAELLDDASAMG